MTLHPFSRPPPPIAFLLVLALIPVRGEAQASNPDRVDWSMCSVPVVTTSGPVDYSEFAAEISADHLLGESRNALYFSGEVDFQRHQQHIRADRLDLYSNPDRIEARGNTLFTDALLRISSESFALDRTQDQGLFADAHFQVLDQHLWGTATQLEQLDSEHQQLTNVSFTTCDPEDDAWSLSAESLELDHSSRQGTARGAVLRIRSMPVFYFPWLRFPLGEDRLSGILTPTIGNSSEHGTRLSVPVYWNLAEHYDMTITPVAFSNRGLQLNTENRYLFDNHSGQVQYSTLHDDSTEDHRWYRSWQHHARLPGGIDASLQLQRTSDERFLDDFDDGDFPANTDFLPSEIRLSKGFSNWQSQLQLREYQVINLATAVATRPYQLKPRISLNRLSLAEANDLNFTWENELTRFEREDSTNGDRLRIVSTVSYPMQGDYYFLEPKLQLDLTQYQLEPLLDGPQHIERAIPLASLDSGLIFERNVGSGGDWLQTLEPRLYLLYVPYEEQDDIPAFDTSLALESYDRLFTNNRFYGGDRIGDAQQISLGITTRLIEPQQGREVFSASFGQAFFARERRVSLDSSVDQRDKSGFMTLLQYQPTDTWTIGASNIFDTEKEQSTQTDIALRYHNQPVVLNLEYHYREDLLEQSTLSAVYPLTNRWTGFFKRQFSIREDRPLRNLVGAAYESCCWQFQFLYEEEADDITTETEYAVYMQLTLKGFSSTGRDISGILDDGILGYSPN